MSGPIRVTQRPVRTVYAEGTRDGDLVQVAKYTGQPTWWAERFHLSEKGRRRRAKDPLRSITDAARLAADLTAGGGAVYLNRPGASRFDEMVRATLPLPQSD